MYSDFDGEMRKISASLQSRDAVGRVRLGGMDGNSSLAENVKREAEKYCSREEALASLNHVYSRIKKYHFNGDISEIYTVQVSDSEGEPPDAAVIGRWLDTLKDNHGYFATPRRIPARQRRHVAGKPALVLPVSALPASVLPAATLPAFVLPAAPAATLPARPHDYVDVEESVVCGFSFTADVPLTYLMVRLSPRYASAAPAECYTVALLSRSHVRLFCGVAQFRYIDWDRTARVGPVDWSTEEVLLRDRAALAQAADRVCGRFSDVVESHLRAEYGMPITVANAAE